MPGLWIGFCLTTWALAGYGFWRVQPSARQTLRRMSRGARAVLGPFLLVMSAAVLWFGLQGLSGYGPLASLGTGHWLLIALIGAIFVLSQCLAAATMLSLAEADVTNRLESPSKIEDSEGNIE